MGILNPAKLLSKETQKANEDRRDAIASYWFTAILSLPFLGFGLFRIITASGSDRLIGIIEIVVLFALIINALLYRKHRRGDITKPIISLTAALLVIILIFSGGTGGTGIFWYFVLLSTNFPFLGLRKGLVFSFLYTSILVLIAAGTYAEVFHTAYDINQYTQVLIVSIVLLLSNWASARALHDYQLTIAKQQERMRILLQGMPAGVILFSVPEGRPTITNPAMEKILSQGVRDDISLEDFIMIYRLNRENGMPVPTEELAPAITLSKGVKAVTKKTFVTRKDGSKIIIRISSAPILDQKGEMTSIIGVFEDVTKQHETEKAKTELVSLASSQLQNPMDEIKEKIESLLAGEAGQLNDEQKDLVQPIIQIIQRLTDFISDLLSVNDMEGRENFHIDPEIKDIVPILNSVSSELKIIAERRNVNLALELPDSLMMKVDERKLQELFTNLIGNAIKYAKNGGQVTVKTMETKASPHTLVVQDDGIGIPEEEQKQIFRRFFRASNVNDSVEGTGLGLYIAKKIVNGHGGRIWFESKEGEGTSFFVAIPPA